MTGYILFEDGTVLKGLAMGKTETVIGYLSFHTEMAGYENYLFSPVNHGKIMAMTFPLIGAYGFMETDGGKGKPKAVIAKSFEKHPSHYQNEKDIKTVFEEKGIFGLSGVDTRQLTRVTRDYGTAKVMLTCEEITDESLEKLRSYEIIDNAAAEMSVKEHTVVESGEKSIGILDLGDGENLANLLTKYNITSHVFPYNTKADEILGHGLKALIASNGGGSAAGMAQSVECLKKLNSKIKLFGIGIGFIALAKALSCDIYKMSAGHRGGNYPVLEHSTGKVLITSQNIGEAIVKEAMPQGIDITHTNVNDNAVEGIKTKNCQGVSFELKPDISSGKCIILEKWLEVL